MAVVSLHRITSMRGGLVFDREYTGIINKLRMSGINADPLKWLSKLAMSCMSEYFSSKMKGEINYTGRTLQLKREELDEYNALQSKLLGASWTLLRQYRLSDSYRLTQNGLDKFYAAMQETDPSKPVRMLKYIEGDFAMYSPYWFCRGYSAQEAGDITEDCAEKLLRACRK